MNSARLPVNPAHPATPDALAGVVAPRIAGFPCGSRPLRVQARLLRPRLIPLGMRGPSAA